MRKKLENLKSIHRDWIQEQVNRRMGPHPSLEQIFGNLTIPGSKQALFLTSSSDILWESNPCRRLQQIKPQGTHLQTVSSLFSDNIKTGLLQARNPTLQKP